MRLILPSKKHPEDQDPTFSALAQFILMAGLLFGLWGGWQFWQWSRSADWKETSGGLVMGSVALVKSGVSEATFFYEVEGKTYHSQDIAFGGRPWNWQPVEGGVMVYYDPADPRRAVMRRQLVETVYIALVLALVSPFLARWIWDKYA